MGLFRDLAAQAYARAHGAQGAPEIDVEDLKAMLDAKEPVVLLDVREPSEWDAGRLEGAKHIPLAKLGERAGELDPSAQTVVYCQIGGRSARAVVQLQKLGFKDVVSLAGGIEAWNELTG